MLGKLLSEYWWVLLLRGILAIAFGVLAFSWPGLTWMTLVIFFAAWIFVDGIFDVFHAFAGRKDNENWWLLLLEGLLGIAFGVITYQAPHITTLVLLLYIAFWAITSGILRIVLAIRLRKEIEGEWFMALAGVASILFGMIMIARPGTGAMAVLMVIAAWSIIVGTFMVILSFKARGFGKALTEASEGSA